MRVCSGSRPCTGPFQCTAVPTGFIGIPEDVRSSWWPALSNTVRMPEAARTPLPCLSCICPYCSVLTVRKWYARSALLVHPPNPPPPAPVKAVGSRRSWSLMRTLQPDPLQPRPRIPGAPCSGPRALGPSTRVHNRQVPSDLWYTRCATSTRTGKCLEMRRTPMCSTWRMRNPPGHVTLPTSDVAQGNPHGLPMADFGACQRLQGRGGGGGGLASTPRQTPPWSETLAQACH